MLKLEKRKRGAIIAIVLLVVSVTFQLFGVSGLWSEPSSLASATFDYIPGDKLPEHVPVP